MASSTLPLAKKAEVLLKRVRKWDTEFLCLGSGNKDSFNVPRPEEILPRVTANVDYFCINYAICLALFALVAVVVFPQLLVLVCVFSGLWYGLLTRPPHMKLQVGAAIVSRLHLTYALAAVNGLIVLVFARTMIFATIGASFLCVLSHAALHSVPSKAHSGSTEQEP